MFGISIGPKKICAQCGSTGSPKTQTRGNILIEIILWCCLLLPGLLYSIWRSGSKFKVCSECEGMELVPLKSPRGKKLLEEYG